MSDKQRVSFLIGRDWWDEFKKVCEKSGLTVSEQIRDSIYKRVVRELQEKKKEGEDVKRNLSRV